LAADEVADESSSFLYISEAEADALPMLCDDICERYGVDFEPPRVDFKLKDGDVLELAGLKLRVFLTPGHTPGSTGYLITEPESNLIHYFSGDTIFARDLGRTDLVGGDPAVLEKSLEKIAQLPDDTIIYPGHGPTTTIERESAHSYWPR
jgi:glyoxylase-like metal-dependent hydrolase (beta-lactamase superfamily II)